MYVFRSLAYICFSIILAHPVESVHIEVRTPYPGEIYNTEEMYLDFSVRDTNLEATGESLIVTINGAEAMRTSQNDNFVMAGSLPKGLHYLSIHLLDRDGKPTGIHDDREFEITTFQPPELIMPLPDGAVGIHSHDLPLPDGAADPADLSGHVQRLLEAHQNPTACAGAPFLIWEPWGIVGFGAQLLGLRVALSLGLQARGASPPHHSFSTTAPLLSLCTPPPRSTPLTRAGLGWAGLGAGGAGGCGQRGVGGQPGEKRALSTLLLFLFIFVITAPKPRHRHLFC